MDSIYGVEKQHYGSNKYMRLAEDQIKAKKEKMMNSNPERQDYENKSYDLADEDFDQ